MGFFTHQIKRPFTLGELYQQLDAREEIQDDVADNLQLLALLDPVPSSYKPRIRGLSRSRIAGLKVARV